MAQPMNTNEWKTVFLTNPVYLLVGGIRFNCYEFSRLTAQQDFFKARYKEWNISPGRNIFVFLFVNEFPIFIINRCALHMDDLLFEVYIIKLQIHKFRTAQGVKRKEGG